MVVEWNPLHFVLQKIPIQKSQMIAGSLILVLVMPSLPHIRYIFHSTHQYSPHDAETGYVSKLYPFSSNRKSGFGAEHPLTSTSAACTR